MKETFSWVGVTECKGRGTPKSLQASPDLKRHLALFWAVTADASAALRSTSWWLLVGLGDAEVAADGPQLLWGWCQILLLDLSAWKNLAIAWLNVKWGPGFEPFISAAWGCALAKESPTA